MAIDHIEWLARRAAFSGLRLKPARDLFNALYAADALALEDGNMTKAALRAGGATTAPGLRRMLRRSGSKEDSTDLTEGQE